MTSGLRLLSVCCAVLTATSPLVAQTVLGPKGPVNPEQKQPTGREPGEPYVYRLTVTPAPEPQPPLKYALYPRWNELKPGNSVPMWYRALSETWTNSPHMEPLRENVERWFDEPWDAMPVEEVRPFIENRRYSLADAREAAFREETDWDLGLRDLRGRETIEIRLGEFQDARTLARILSLRTRLSLLDGDFDAALSDMAVALRLAHDIAEPESFINDLIGIAIVAITEDNIRHLIDTPGSPNMYWALAELPDPLIDLRPATQLELTLPERFFPWIKDPVGQERTVEQWHELLQKTLRELGDLHERETLPRSDASELAVNAALLGLTLRGYPTARRDLMERGYELAEIDAKLVGKVVALHERLIYDTLWQSYAAAASLPYQAAQRRFERLEIVRRDQGYHVGDPWQQRETLPIASLLLPGVAQVQMAQVRRDVMRAALMVVEAVRMHLSSGDGRLPRSLDDIDVVPVPENPWTDAPFTYKLRGDVAVIDFPLPHYHRRIEVRVDDAAAE